MDTEPPVVETFDVEGTYTDGNTVYANETVRINATTDTPGGELAGVRFVLDAGFTNYRTSTAGTYDQSSGNWTATIDLANLIDDGRYDVHAVATDTAGNRNDTVAVETLAVDRESAELAATVTREDSATGRVNLTADESLRSGSLTVSVERPGDGDVTVTMADSGDHWTGTFPLGSSGGQYNVTAAALDSAGNLATTVSNATIRNWSTDANDTITVKLVPSNLFVRFTTDRPVSDTFITMTGSHTPFAPLVRGQAGVNFLNARLDSKLTGNLSYATIGIPVDPSLLRRGPTPTTCVSAITTRRRGTGRHFHDGPNRHLDDGTAGSYWVANVTHFSTYGAVVRTRRRRPSPTPLPPTATSSRRGRRRRPFGSNSTTRSAV